MRDFKLLVSSLGVSLDVFAYVMGIPKSTANKYHSGERVVPATIYARAAALFAQIEATALAYRHAPGNLMNCRTLPEPLHRAAARRIQEMRIVEELAGRIPGHE